MASTDVQSLHQKLLSEWAKPDGAVRYAWECVRLEGDARRRYATGYEEDFAELRRIMELAARLIAIYDTPCLRNFEWLFTCVAPMNGWDAFVRAGMDNISLNTGLSGAILPKWTWSPSHRRCKPHLNEDLLSGESRLRFIVFTECYDEIKYDSQDMTGLIYFDLWNDVLHRHFVPRCWPSEYTYDTDKTDQVGELARLDFSAVRSPWEPELSSHEKLEIELQEKEAVRELRVWLEGKASPEEIKKLIWDVVGDV